MLIILSSLAGLIAWPILNSRAAGDPLSGDSPRPSNRVDTGLGMSIVLPEHWIVSDASVRECQSNPESHNTFTAFPQTAYLGQRPGATLHVHRCAREPDFDYIPVQSVHFGDDTAQQFVHVYETNSIPIVSCVTLFLEHNARWWRVTYVYNGSLTKCPQSVQAYLETIVFDSEAGGESSDAGEAAVAAFSIGDWAPAGR